MRRLLSVLAVLMITGSLIAACGDDDDGGGRGSSGGRDQPLVGTQWILDQDASRLTFVTPAAVVTAQFSSDGSVDGNAGCNSYGASYSVKGSTLRIDGPVSRTLMSCGPAVDRVETAYLRRFRQAKSFAIDGQVLTIQTSGEGPLVYRALDAEEALAGDWVVTGYFRPGAIVSPIVGSTLTATFEEGRISGNAGCNTYSGRYETDGTKIVIGPLASTRMACADAAVGQQEAEYLAALELARTISLGGGNLTLLRDDGGTAVTYARR